MKKNNTHAFTLVETLVAIAILMLAILGPFTIIASSLKNAFSARDQMTAYYLAQEGIDYIRFVRDNVNLSNPSKDSTKGFTWNDFYTSMLGACGGSETCDLSDVRQLVTSTDISSSAIFFPDQGCSTSDPCPVLYITPSGNYTHVSTAPNIPTIFSRTISVTSNDPNKLTVNVKMQWRSNNINKVFTLSEELFNIY